MDDQKASILALVRAVGELDDAQALDAAARLADAGMDARDIQKTVETGVRIVMDEYRRGEYFISDLLVADRMYARVMSLPHLARMDAAPSRGGVVLGGCPWDVHDAGAEASVASLASRGVAVTYLGLGVPAGEFIEAAERGRAAVVALSSMSEKGHERLASFIAELRAGLGRGVAVVLRGAGSLSGSYAALGADVFAEDVLSLSDYCLARTTGAKP